MIQLGVAAFTAPQFRLSQIEISGLKDTPRANVESLLAPLWGQNVFRAPRAQVAADIASLPTIASAKIQLHPTWPPRAELVVVEREPILRVGRAQKWWVADRAGVLFRRATSQDAALYPVEAPDATLATMKTLPASFWTRAVELHDALESDNRLALQVLNDSSARGQGTARANRPFWQLHRIEFGDDGAVNLNLERSETPLLTAPSSPESSANGDAAKTRENALLIRLGDEEWAPKLARARQALDYFERTGRRAAELDLVSFRRPRWRPIVVESDTPGS